MWRGDARSLRVEVEVPAGLARYIAPKGSVALDGVSLTVNDVRDRRFAVNLDSAHDRGHHVCGSCSGQAP